MYTDGTAKHYKHFASCVLKSESKENLTTIDQKYTFGNPWDCQVCSQSRNKWQNYGLHKLLREQHAFSFKEFWFCCLKIWILVIRDHVSEEKFSIYPLNSILNVGYNLGIWVEIVPNGFPEFLFVQLNFEEELLIIYLPPSFLLFLHSLPFFFSSFSKRFKIIYFMMD